MAGRCRAWAVPYRKSNFVMIGILVISILSSFVMWIALRIVGNKPSSKIVNGHTSGSDSDEFQDGAARREREQRGFSGMWWNKRS